MAEYTYEAYGRENPCDNCPAPCCQAQLHTYQAPNTFKDLDMIRYRLQFPETELVICRTGEWYLLHWKTCSRFRKETYSCSLQGTAEKPQVCSFFNQYDCWFKQNVVVAGQSSAIRVDQNRFEEWAKGIRLDERGKVVAFPPFDEMREMVADIPISHVFSILPPGDKTKLRGLMLKEK